MTDQTTEITARIKAFTEGKISEADLVKYLTKDVRYTPAEVCPYNTGTPDWYEWQEVGKPYVPGSWGEVHRAVDVGLLPLDTYRKISSVIGERSEPPE